MQTDFRQMTAAGSVATAASYHLSPDIEAELRRHLRDSYRDIFTDEAISAHIRDYVGMTFADSIVGVVADSLRGSVRILDIGSGFGSFVLACRNRGLNAMGVEISDYEVAFARRRLSVLRPDDDAESVYVLNDARELRGERNSFGAVTLWNVLEHIDNADRVIRTASELLEPGGALFVICPNYAAFRQEAHYHVPWLPMLPRTLASRYLKLMKRDPGFFETSIFYRTNWGVMRSLSAAGLELYDFSATQSMAPGRKTLRRMIRHPQHVLAYYNPFKESVVLAARKPA